ncbi:Scr1 family TA system antitoxin-like transcriptional regulator [Glycomyces tritici]|uniref:Scr1 family TA system antitoxin-like transcriptional regulator n=1 Tax=Glycomyces tritici TaxID=2665176 RepID=A0ABT7YQ00_9ACTN|nr:Scr1 family TA system antitoxin-like transcriptional regulator [Glycomyces tritici]MDN3240484.1 Scr1 family TA system antitoxin-like transcriptional regulator [Glycomyces tritici]
MPIARIAEWFVPVELNALKRESKLTCQQIGAKLGVSVRTVTNYLSGETRPKAGMAAQYARICGASEKRIDFLSHVITQLDNGVIVSELSDRNIFIVELAEATSGEIWKWEPLYIPGPLQIEQYHSGILPEREPDVHVHFQRKLRRYLTLIGRRPAPKMHFLLSGNALRYLDGWEWADKQLAKLIEADDHPDCEVRVLEGLHRGMDHSYEIYLPDGRPGAAPPFVFVEALDQSRHVEEAFKVELYHDRIKHMWSSGTRIGRWLDDRSQ